MSSSQEARVDGQSEHQTVQSPEGNQQSFSGDSQAGSRQASHPTLPPSAVHGSGGNTARRDFSKMRRPSSPNASSAPITQASGAYTGGVVNRHPNSEAVHQEYGSGGNTGAPSAGHRNSEHGSGNSELIAFRVGVSEDRNQKCRRTMEDSHAFVYDYGGVKVCMLPSTKYLPPSTCHLSLVSVHPLSGSPSFH